MEKTAKAAREFLTDYLSTRGLRKTAERYAILEEIYTHTGHIEAEALFLALGKRYRVSRATVYNTLELLLECGLILRHQFGRSSAQYEKAWNVPPHGHLVCTACGRVEEFTDSRLDDVVADAGEMHRFEAEHRSLYVYGKCRRCQLKTVKKGGKSV